MEDKGWRGFVLAVETGSLTGAAKRLGVSQPAVSQQLAALESGLGQQLLVRSRKGVQLTPAGEIVYQHGLRVLASQAEMQSALEELSGSVGGRLRVTVNMLFGQAIMGPVLARLRERHPGLRIDVLATDQVLDLEAEGVDLAVRGGSAGTGRGMVRRIGMMEGVLVATPAYLDSVGRPSGPSDLVRLSYVQYRDDPEERQIAMAYAEGTLEIPVTPAFSAQHPDLTLHAMCSGLGFAKSPLFFILDRLESGVLEEVLPGYRPVPKPIYLVTREHLRDTPNVRAFRTALAEQLSATPGFLLSSDLTA